MKKGEILKSGSTVLPAPTVLTVGDEIIWTSSTGRTISGKMVGNVVTEKKNLQIQWNYLTESDVKLIKSKLIAGWFPLTFRDDGMDITIQSYRGTLSKEMLGDIGDGNFYYKTVSVDIVQRVME